MLLESFLIALQLALIAVTVVLTLSNYGALPERIPTHFGFSPVPDRYGPKVTAWLLPAMQVVVLCIETVAYYAGAGASKTPLTAILAINVAIAFVLLAAQWQIIETAKQGPSAGRTRTFWSVFAATMLVVLSVAFFAK